MDRRGCRPRAKRAQIRPEELPDEELARRLARRDEAAWRELDRRFGPEYARWAGCGASGARLVAWRDELAFRAYAPGFIYSVLHGFTPRGTGSFRRWLSCVVRSAAGQACRERRRACEAGLRSLDEAEFAPALDGSSWAPDHELLMAEEGIHLRRIVALAREQVSALDWLVGKLSFAFVEFVGPPSMDEIVAGRGTRAHVRRALARAGRSPVGGLETAEIARLLCMSEGHVYKARSRFVAALRRAAALLEDGARRAG